MSRFAMGGDEYHRGAPSAQCEMFLRVIDAGGEDLRVFVIDGSDGTLSPGVAERNATGDCDVVAVYFRNVVAGTINGCSARIGAEAKAAGKRFAVIGQRRGALSPEVQALADWVIY